MSDLRNCCSEEHLSSDQLHHGASFHSLLVSFRLQITHRKKGEKIAKGDNKYVEKVWLVIDLSMLYI